MRFTWLHYPELAAFFVNHPDFASANPIVDTDSVAHLPEIPFCDKSPSSLEKHQRTRTASP
jgi:hypothetical protein